MTGIWIFPGPRKVYFGLANVWSFSHEVCAPMTVTAAPVSSLKRVLWPLIPSWAVHPPLVWTSPRNRTSSPSSCSSSSSSSYTFFVGEAGLRQTFSKSPLFLHLLQVASLAWQTWRWCLSRPHHPQLWASLGVSLFGSFLFPDFPELTNSTKAALLSPRTKSRFCVLDSA